MVLGVDFMALRLVSLVASLGCLGLLFALVRRETGSMIAAALAACLYAATYRLSGAWFDIARPDSLYLLLILAALAALRLDPSRWRAAIAAGVLFSLAFLAKQSALVVAAPVILYMIVTELRPGFLLIATMVVLVGGSTLLLDRLSHGWYGY